MRLEHRLRNLERAAGTNGPKPCPACGRTPGQKITTIKTYFGTSGDPEPDFGPDYCPACGEHLVIRVELDRGG